MVVTIITEFARERKYFLTKRARKKEGGAVFVKNTKHINAVLTEMCVSNRNRGIKTDSRCIFVTQPRWEGEPLPYNHIGWALRPS